MMITNKLIVMGDNNLIVAGACVYVYVYVYVSVREQYRQKRGGRG